MIFNNNSIKKIVRKGIFQFLLILRNFLKSEFQSRNLMLKHNMTLKINFNFKLSCVLALKFRL